MRFKKISQGEERVFCTFNGLVLNFVPLLVSCYIPVAKDENTENIKVKPKALFLCSSLYVQGIRLKWVIVDY